MDHCQQFYSHGSTESYWSSSEEMNPPTWPMGTCGPWSIGTMEPYMPEFDRSLLTHPHRERPSAIVPLPDVPANAFSYDDPYTAEHMLPSRYSSPSCYSALSTTDPSSVYSPRELSPLSSPEITPMMLLDPSVVHLHGGQSRYDGVISLSSYNAQSDLHCSMRQIQHHPDPLEVGSCDEESLVYGYYAQEGYHPLHVDSHTDVAPVPDQAYPRSESTSPTNNTEPPPMLRRRRASSARSPTSPRSIDKITKRTAPARRASAHSTTTTTIQREPDRSFPCAFSPYGCPASFGSKNEWKRHVATQHMRLGYWRCDECGHRDNKPNDFNRKDLFIQHVRRMHHPPPTAPASDKSSSGSSSPKSSKAKPNGAGSRNRKPDAEDEALANIATRCFKQLRSPPSRSCCLFCEAEFEGPKSWDERMEHVGRHMETGAKKGGAVATAGCCAGDPTSWKRDEETERWLLEERIVERRGQGGLVLV